MMKTSSLLLILTISCCYFIAIVSAYPGEDPAPPPPDVQPRTGLFGASSSSAAIATAGHSGVGVDSSYGSVRVSDNSIGINSAGGGLAYTGGSALKGVFFPHVTRKIVAPVAAGIVETILNVLPQPFQMILRAIFKCLQRLFRITSHPLLG